MHEHDEDQEPDLEAPEPDAEMTVSIDKAHAGMRLDVFVAAALEGATRSEAQRLIELPDQVEEGVRVNGRREKSNYRLRAGDTVSGRRPPSRPVEAQPESIPLSIVFED